MNRSGTAKLPPLLAVIHLIACSGDPDAPSRTTPGIDAGAGGSSAGSAGSASGAAGAGGVTAGAGGVSSGGGGVTQGGAGSGGSGGAVTLLPPSRISFSSCSDARYPMEAMDVATNLNPELHVFLGDNVYADTTDMAEMQLRYDELANAAEFKRLAAQAELVATWDDHDYGANDSGKYYPMKEESREIFLNFWNEPADSLRRQHPGVYTSYVYEGDAHTLQIILLDTRTFRDDLTLNDGSGKNDYIPNAAPELEFLGQAQWEWLEQQLSVPAELRIIGSSNQFGHEYNGYESWTNFPSEQQRMLDLIASTQASGVIFLSGDVHWGEVSKRELAAGYELYDFTSSGINENWPEIETNQFRVGEAIAEYNVGFMEIDWAASSLTVSLYDYLGVQRNDVTLAFSDIAY